MVPVGSANRGVPASLKRAEERSAYESVDARSLSEDPSILPVQVRRIGVRDVVSLRRLDQLYRLDQPHSILQPYSLLRSGLTASLPGRRGARPAFVAHAADRLVGFAHFRALLSDESWLLVALGSSVGVFEVDPVWGSAPRSRRATSRGQGR